MREPGSARHCCGDRDDLLIGLGKFRERLADDFGISRRRRRRGFAALDLVFAEAVKFIRLFDRRFVAFAFFRQNVKQHRLFLRFQKFKCPDQQRDIVSVDRPVITQSEFLENNARYDQAFDAFLDFVRKLDDRFYRAIA